MRVGGFTFRPASNSPSQPTALRRNTLLRCCDNDHSFMTHSSRFSSVAATVASAAKEIGSSDISLSVGDFGVEGGLGADRLGVIVGRDDALVLAARQVIEPRAHRAKASHQIVLLHLLQLSTFLFNHEEHLLLLELQFLALASQDLVYFNSP